jgi:hypothetical protein
MKKYLTIRAKCPNVFNRGRAFRPGQLPEDIPMKHPMQSPSCITAQLIEEAARMDFLPTVFGPRLMMRGEGQVYSCMRQLSADYNGGFWNFYSLSNGGFYMAPDGLKSLHIVCDGNFFAGDFSADAAGIVATLFALCYLANSTSDDSIIERYHLLIEYAGQHEEAPEIFRAID